MNRKEDRLGDILLEQGLINTEQLNTALEMQRETRSKLGQQLLDLGFITESDIANALATKYGVPKVELHNYWIDAGLVDHLPESDARRFTCLLLEDTGRDYLVVMSQPGDLVAIDELQRVLKRPIRTAVAEESAIRELINKTYRRSDEISNIAEEVGSQLSPEENIDLSDLLAKGERSTTPVVRLLQSVLEDAVQTGASDIHIEPDEDILRIRMRRDGMLHEQIIPQRNIHRAMISLLKLFSGLNITERRIPQDGRFQIKVNERNIDVRLSTLPQYHGEAAVMRLLDQSGKTVDLDGMGYPEDMLKRIRRLIHMPYGMILVTGPTGSGKSTSLYGMLSEVNREEVKIITVEDPIEYRMSRVNQVQVRDDIGLSFARVLRTVLRQDPDIIMVGEIRDHETAEIALRAAITGHLVFSTLHTNDAISTANRLLDMGVESFMLAGALRAIIAQRLVRRICTFCREPYELNDKEWAWARVLLRTDEPKHSFYRGRGCNACGRSGYSGRVGVYELLELDARMVDTLGAKDQNGFAAACRASPHYVPMAQLALGYANKGITTLEEVYRVFGALEDMNELAASQQAKAVEAALAQSSAEEPVVPPVVQAVKTI